MKTNLKAIPTIFHLDANGEANGEVEEFCSISCANIRQAHLKSKQTDFSNDIGESRHLLGGAQCTSCGTLVSDITKGETVADFMTWVHNLDIDNSMPISCSGALGFSLTLDGDTVVIDASNKNSIPLVTLEQMCAFIDKSNKYIKNVGNKLLFSVCGESGFSARIDSGCIALDSADISFD
jgi:hypothetical protein